MEAFPAVLKEIPNAQLIVAGANHHTKAGYWESIREAQPAHLPIEFRGYVAEEDIPELFRTTSVLVLPYDSATGSSGPAHQACEYGVPIVGADIEDFRDMGADEDMAIRFYKVGDASDLANQLITVLRSPELQRSMGQQNFAAGLEMTIGRVVRNYLRWFELNKYKRTLAKSPENRGIRFRSWSARKNAAPHSKPIQGEDNSENHGRESAGNNPQAIDFVDPFA
jgi:glycosyltransferase involved in cell wall biosynthesis